MVVTALRVNFIPTNPTRKQNAVSSGNYLSCFLKSQSSVCELAIQPPEAGNRKS